jgi:hypothetical protein
MLPKARVGGQKVVAQRKAEDLTKFCGIFKGMDVSLALAVKGFRKFDAKFR